MEYDFTPESVFEMLLGLTVFNHINNEGEQEFSSMEDSDNKL